MSSAITRSARGEACQVRLPGCLPGTETTVWHHLRIKGIGIGRKNVDAAGAYVCRECHRAVHGLRKVPGYTTQDIELAEHEGHIRSLVMLIENGFLK